MLETNGDARARGATSLDDGERAAVVIVGAGPVGLVTAIELTRAGLHPILVEAKDDLAWSSRAICISRRSQEILERIGAGPAFAAKALPWSSGRTFHRDRLVFRLDMPHAAGDRHAPFVNLQQFHTERFLLDALEAAGGAGCVRWGTRVTGIRQDGDGLSLDVSTADGERVIRAEWLVAADGGRSAVREAMGLQLAGTAYEGRYLIADIEVEGVDLSVERRVWFDPISNPGSTVILHVQPDRVWRIDYQLRDGEDAEDALRDENVMARLQAQLDMMGIRAPWRLIWKSVYKALALSLDDYRHGRVLFAGDAAHLVPIFGVRGLNSGIDDAHNLAWKLAMVARGEASASLLGTYSHERRRATRENHEQATKSTWFMSPPGPGFTLMRDAVLSLAADHAWASALINPRQSSTHSYDDSPAIQPDGTPCDVGLRPGDPVPNLPVRRRAGVRDDASEHAPSFLLDTLPRSGFTLLVFIDHVGGATVTDRLVDAPALAGAPLTLLLAEGGPAGEAGGVAGIIDDGTLAERFAASRFPVYLIRPDEHVAARFGTVDPAAVAAALDQVLGRSPGRATGPAPRQVGVDQVADAERRAVGVGLGQAGLERVFETLSRALNEAGDGGAEVLARLSLLLAERLGDEAAVLRCVNTAHAGDSSARGPTAARE